ncbi:hypothetical protein E8E11_011419 [Didymella keratinophila]|nr:hypothetical protein E8E11_011419 [Didymella keratinophila]
MALQLPPIFTTLQPPLILLTNILTLAIGPQHRFLQFAFSVPVLFILAAQSLYREWNHGWGLHYGLNCFVVTLLVTWVDWILLNSPYKEGWTKQKQRKGTERPGVEKIHTAAESPELPRNDGAVVQSAPRNRSIQNPQTNAPPPFLHRLRWAACLATTTRYISWTSEVKNAPRSVSPTYPRWKFLIRKMLRFGLFFLLKDAVYSYTASSPHGTWLDLFPSSPVIGFAGYSFTYRLYYTWVYIALTYVSLELMTTLYSLVSVATYLATPHSCPRMFNDLRYCWGVRQAWSVVWHQQIRRLCSAPGVFLARDVLNLPRGSFASKYTQLFMGFAVSGAIHAGAAMLCHASLVDDYAMRVFLYQATLIFVEDHAIKLGKKMGFRDSMGWRVAGYAWTALAIGTSLQSWTSRSLGHGLWVHDRENDFFGLGPK